MVRIPTQNFPMHSLYCFCAKLSVAKVPMASLPDGFRSLLELPPAPNLLLLSLLSIQGGEQQADPETILTSDANGLFSIKGLDAVLITCVKSKPQILQSLTEDIEVKITATIYNGQSWDGNPATALTALSVTANGAPGTLMLLPVLLELQLETTAAMSYPKPVVSEPQSCTFSVLFS